MALWHRQPHAPIMVHSDQDCQFSGHEWQTVLRDHNRVSRNPWWKAYFVAGRGLITNLLYTNFVGF